MLTTHKISADQFYDSFELIAVHSSLDDYAMAYVLNKHLGLRLKRNKSDHQIGQGATYPVFGFFDEVSDFEYTLFRNKCMVVGDDSAEGLFKFNAPVQKHYLVQEKKEVDYLLKINADGDVAVDQIIREINAIPNIITAYRLNVDLLKSKANLIF
ncbi:IPExxxVDY family protein [Flagellimonas lutaonensis]|uniref:IPExxxVDY family protein n=1 Tax=Flagellimonas lutaonensis TaxID=516051 RepID=A0A0D5YRJ0_9FLAO|nr:IPExxxVDY family protein [Allomuricauda lutaonensis]AKA34882.1 hypothetical protein VC82_1249 [Allomuricauda lutaonensis]